MLRADRPDVDGTYLSRRVAGFLNNLIQADPEAAKELLFTPIPVNEKLLFEIGLGKKIVDGKPCEVMCFDILVFLCGYAKFEGNTVGGLLVFLFEHGATMETIKHLRGIVPYADLPLGWKAQNVDIPVAPPSSDKFGCN